MCIRDRCMRVEDESRTNQGDSAPHRRGVAATARGGGELGAMIHEFYWNKMRVYVCVWLMILTRWRQGSSSSARLTKYCIHNQHNIINIILWTNPGDFIDLFFFFFVCFYESCESKFCVLRALIMLLKMLNTSLSWFVDKPRKYGCTGSQTS